jgi:hypothetical protein
VNLLVKSFDQTVMDPVAALSATLIPLLRLRSNPRPSSLQQLSALCHKFVAFL